MHLIDQRTLGTAILVLLGILVSVKRIATGSILDKPEGNLMVQLVNIFNLLFLLVVNPLAAVLLMTGWLETADPTHLMIYDQRVLMIMEILGLAMYVTGFALMAASLITLGRNYQLGGSPPRSEDTMVSNGPYRLVRHPMYTSALSISAGLTCLIQSWASFSVFLIYLVLIMLLVPAEESVLKKAYGRQYATYQQKARRLIPFLY
jgi:protein-S-isoprenylcysteine O-methyltransferase Ste14